MVTMPAYRGKTEIAWEIASRRVIDRVQGELGFVGHVHHGISYFHKDDMFQNLRYDDADFHGQLSEKFLLSDTLPGCTELTFLHRPCRGGEAAGYITEDFQVALVVGSGFGLFKSAVSGLASLQVEPAGYVPAHAAALSLNGKGVLMIGGSGGGKTTALLNVAIHALSRQVDVKILCDDWLVVRHVDGRLVASTFDPSISLTRADLERAISLEEIDGPRLLGRLETRDKISLSPSCLFGQGVQAREVGIDAIVLINPSAGLDKVERCAAGDVADFIIGSAYHFPYVCGQMRDRHRAFWSSWADRVSVYEYSYLGTSDFRSSISRLADGLVAAA
jgi:hypothetical protein